MNAFSMLRCPYVAMRPNAKLGVVFGRNKNRSIIFKNRYFDYFCQYYFRAVERRLNQHIQISKIIETRRRLASCGTVEKGVSSWSSARAWRQRVEAATKHSVELENLFFFCPEFLAPNAIKRRELHTKKTPGRDDLAGSGRVISKKKKFARDRPAVNSFRSRNRGRPFARRFACEWRVLGGKRNGRNGFRRAMISPV